MVPAAAALCIQKHAELPELQADEVLALARIHEVKSKETRPRNSLNLKVRLQDFKVFSEIREFDTLVQ